MLVFESQSENDVGSYEVPLLASLVDYPVVGPYKQKILVEITKVEPIIDDSISVAWFLLPVAIVVFFVSGFLIGGLL